MEKPVWTQNYTVNSFLVNTQKKLGVYSLLNLLQDTSWVHASHLKHGFEDMMKRNIIWVLTRQRLVMDKWPAWGEEVAITTWIRSSASGPYANRDFEIKLGGEIIGHSTTSWLMMNVETRTPVREDLSTLSGDLGADHRVPFEAPKIPLIKEVETRASFKVRNSDLDINQHVNNTRYAQWVLDSIPAEWHSLFVLQEYEVNFLAETKAEDQITIQMTPENKNFNEHPFWVQFQGFRETDQKVVFSARLKVRAKPLQKQ